MGYTGRIILLHDLWWSRQIMHLGRRRRFTAVLTVSLPFMEVMQNPARYLVRFGPVSRMLSSRPSFYTIRVIRLLADPAIIATLVAVLLVVRVMQVAFRLALPRTS